MKSLGAAWSHSKSLWKVTWSLNSSDFKWLFLINVPFTTAMILWAHRPAAHQSEARMLGKTEDKAIASQLDNSLGLNEGTKQKVLDNKTRGVDRKITELLQQHAVGYEINRTNLLRWSHALHIANVWPEKCVGLQWHHMQMKQLHWTLSLSLSRSFRLHLQNTGAIFMQGAALAPGLQIYDELHHLKLYPLSPQGTCKWRPLAKPISAMPTTNPQKNSKPHRRRLKSEKSVADPWRFTNCQPDIIDIGLWHRSILQYL